MARLTMLGLYYADPTLFDDCFYPEGVDPKAVRDYILMETGNLSVVFPDADMMKFALKSWCERCQNVWQKLWDTTQFEYNPIWNKDGTFKEIQTRDLANTEKEHGSGNNSGSSAGTETDSVKGFNSSNWAEHDKAVTSGSTTGKYSNDINKQGTDTGTIATERIEQGNIGVTSTQQLIREEREISEFNFYDYLLEDFTARFCIMVY